VKHITILIIFIMLTGCVVYPQKHAAEPMYEVQIDDEGIVGVVLKPSNDLSISALKEISPSVANVGRCDGGRVLTNSTINHFISSPAVYGWMKVAFIVPADSWESIEICATGSDGTQYYWADGYVNVLDA